VIGTHEKSYLRGRLVGGSWTCRQRRGASLSISRDRHDPRAITIIVPFPAGGATDTLARILAEPLRAALHQPVIVENVAGAGGTIGVGRAARAPGDGYTISIGTVSTHIMTALFGA
jgi:tripartite-type tricarboxylate transporter receptor subunit TctC